MEKNFEYAACNIRYQIFGKGKTVVLLHGFGEDGGIWNHQIKFLQAYCRLIVPDLPGSGQSTVLKKDSVQIEDYADVIAALLKHENINSCIMLGHSMGGYITLAFAKKYAIHLNGFGLIHATAYADNEEKKLNRQKGIKMIKEYGSYSFLKNTIPNLFGTQFKTQHPTIIEDLIKNGSDFTKEALIQYYQAMMNRPDRTEVLKSSEVPVLFILGTEDVAAPLKDVLAQSHLPVTSYIHIFENVGHMSMLEAPDELNKHMLTFINEVG